MAVFAKFFSLFKKNEYDDYFGDLDELDELDGLDEFDEGGPQKEFAWDWESLVKDRHKYKLSDDVQREKYIRSLVEQVKDSSVELDSLSAEYNAVTAVLKDMDEIEALPESEKRSLEDTAAAIMRIEGERRDYMTDRSLMSEAQYRAMESEHEELPKAYEELVEAEERRGLIKADLKTLDGEKHAAFYRNNELHRDIENYRGMVMITIFAAVLCVVMLLILQYGFDMNTQVGYIMVALAAALTITFVYVKYLDAVSELGKVQRNINHIILLQNTVKIRYVNNYKLLEYLYIKYKTSSAKELKKLWDAYEDERAKRIRNEENEKNLGRLQKELLARLRKYQLNDVYVWLHNPLALTDHNEMVEIRHSHIVRRQKLRAQMDYHKHLAKEGENELKDLIREYPKYAPEVVEMLDRYS